MEDWQKDLFGILETVTAEVEQFFHEVGEAVEMFADDIGEAFENFATEVENTIAADIDQYVQDFIEPIIEIYLELENFDFEQSEGRVFYFEEDSDEETDLWLNPKLEPTSEHHPACIGCSNYHGRVYGGNLLVCGMHPYGWNDENCPDWEGFDPRRN